MQSMCHLRFVPYTTISTAIDVEFPSQDPWIHVSRQTFADEILRSSAPIIVNVWAPWCAPWRVMYPAFRELATRFKGRIQCCKLDVDDCEEWLAAYGVEAVPALLFFYRGVLCDRVVGLAPGELLEEKALALLHLASTTQARSR